MMECKDVQALWQAYADGELSPGLVAETHAHIDACPSCRALDLSLRSLDHSLTCLADDVPEVPPFLVTRIMARIDEARASHGFPRLLAWLDRLRLPRLATVAVAAAAFLAGVALNETARRALPPPGEPVVAAHRVVIEYQGMEGQEVGLVGDFNSWGKRPAPIDARQSGGTWTFTVDLKPGRYEYAFVIDGKKWLPDPQAAGIIPDGFGGMNSVLYVQREGDKLL